MHCIVLFTEESDLEDVPLLGLAARSAISLSVSGPHLVQINQVPGPVNTSHVTRPANKGVLVS